MGEIRFTGPSASATHHTERFTGELRWLGEAGTTTRPPKLQQRVQVTEYGAFMEPVNATYEWRDVPYETGRE
jgi:hypothetical protein